MTPVVLDVDAAPEVVDVLCEAFYDYPVMRFVLGSPSDYTALLHELMTVYVMARVLRDEVMIGVPGPTALLAAATVSYPGQRESPPELGELRERTWDSLGSAARSRYESFGAANAPFEVEAPHIHLDMIGVRSEAKGSGLGGAMMRAVHDLSEEAPWSTGVTLTTELEANLSFYEHFGYDRVGSARVDAELTTWGFFRPDPAC